MCQHLRLTVLLTSILMCLVIVAAAKHKHRRKQKNHHGPSGMSTSDFMGCDEFAKNARFNPYSVLYETWFVFYYWGAPRGHEQFVFTFPTTNYTQYVRRVMENKTIIPIDWERRQVLMRDHRGSNGLLVERGNRGQYWFFPLYTSRQGLKIRPVDVRFKQVGENNNTILGLMDCDSELVLVMSKIGHVPPQNRLQEEASRIGYIGRRGKSYLYQGHEWMPIPEDDQSNYWYYHPKTEKNTEQSSNEVSSKEQESEEVGNTSGEKIDPPNFNNQVIKLEINQKTDEIQYTKKKLDTQETIIKKDVNSKDEQYNVLANTQENETVDKSKYGSDKMQSQPKESVRDLTKKKLNTQEKNIIVDFNSKDEQDNALSNTPTQQNETEDKSKYGSNKMQSQPKKSVRDLTKNKLDSQETIVLEDVNSKDEEDNALPNTPTQQNETVDKSKYESDNMQTQTKESVRDQTTDSEKDQTAPSTLQNKIEEPESTKKVYSPQWSSDVYGQLNSDNDLANIVPSKEEEGFEPENLDDKNINNPDSTPKPIITETGNEMNLEISVRLESYQTPNGIDKLNNITPAIDNVEH